MKTFIITLFSILSFSSWSANINSIMEKAHLTSYYLGKDGKAQLLMKVFPKKNSKPLTKLFYMLRLDIKDGGEQMFFTYFERPTGIRRTTFLVHKFVNKDDLRKLYIPASDKVLSISGSQKQDPFMGSDFSYEDVSGRHFTKDNHKLIKEAKLNNEDVYVTESIPKVRENKIASIKAWISKKTFIPLKVEYTNHKGKIFKVYETLKIQNIQGYPTIMSRKMSSPLQGSYTEMLVNPKNVQYDIGLTPSVFTERSLRNPPTKYLK